MNVIVIADDTPANAWLIREIERQHEIRSILRPDWNAVRATAQPSRKPVSSSVGTRLTRQLRARYFAALDSADASRLETLLFPDGPPSAPRADVWTVPAWDINGTAVLERLTALAPDLVVVSGAPILKSNIFGIPRLATVNLHFGISPEYRGMHTIVTPWQRGDFAHVGATLHRITDRIDDGPVLFRIYPALDSRDDHISAEAKIVRLAASTLNEMLSWLAPRAATLDSIPGRAQPKTGELIRYHDRTISAQLRSVFARRRAPNQAQRVERWYED
jgi:methionyl-tRNA formyltransferase